MENPFVKPITGVQLVQPTITDKGVGAVVLDRVEPGITPDYCVHGRTTCHWCDEWCWLGSETYKVVASGEAAPMCLQCACALLPPTSLKPVKHLDDHRHA